MKFDVRESGVPIETHTLPSSVLSLSVYRADLAAPEGYAPYVKCCILRPFLEWAKGAGHRKIGYYASRESFWVGTLKRLCDEMGLEAFITHPKTKVPPLWANEMASSLHYLKPNIYAVNYNISRKLVEAHPGGLMLPMGIDVPAFVQLQTEFFDRYPLPCAASYIVPTGSGTALSAVAQHLKKAFDLATIYGIATRPMKSVLRVVQHNGAYRGQIIIHRHQRQESDAPWPVTRGGKRSPIHG
jgi:hypothetical protein